MNAAAISAPPQAPTQAPPQAMAKVLATALRQRSQAANASHAAVVDFSTPDPAATSAWRKARDVADQFERIFVQQMVAKMRENASFGLEEGGMFGSGPGSGTYGDMFDGNLAEHIAHNGGVGVADVILRDLVRLHQLPPQAPAATAVHGANDAASTVAPAATPQPAAPARTQSRPDAGQQVEETRRDLRRQQLQQLLLQQRRLTMPTAGQQPRSEVRHVA